MSGHRQILYHIVFGTKNRKPTIAEEQCEKLNKYIWGTVKEHNSKLYRINGIADHVHIMSDLHPAISLADYQEYQSGKQSLAERICLVSTI